MPEPLKPCPFCDTPAVVETRPGWVQVGCWALECDVAPATHAATMDRAVEAWNTRAAPREPGEAERLKDVLDWFNGDGESLVYRAIEDVAEDGRYNAKHVAQYSCDAIARLLREQLLAAPRPDAGEGTEEA